jgi:hypothetical protein
MKKIILILIIMAALLARGQDYIPLLDENKVWSVAHEKHVLIGDTVINEITYHKLYFHNFLEELTPDSLVYIAAMREDTINRKVYYIWKNFDSEKLLYDFALQVGDTFRTNPSFANYDGPHPYSSYTSQDYYVIGVTDSLFDGVSRRVIALSAYPSDNTTLRRDWFIEGVGSIFGVIYAGYEMIMDGYNPFLLCVHQNETLVHQVHELLFGQPVNGCYLTPEVSVSEIDNRYNDLYIYPSVFDNTINIRSSEPITEVLISDINGRVVYQNKRSENASEITLNTLDWISGLYIVRAGNSQHFVSKKIVKL